MFFLIIEKTSFNEYPEWYGRIVLMLKDELERLILLDNTKNSKISKIYLSGVKKIFFSGNR